MKEYLKDFGCGLLILIHQLLLVILGITILIGILWILVTYPVALGILIILVLVPVLGSQWRKPL